MKGIKHDRHNGLLDAIAIKLTVLVSVALLYIVAIKIGFMVKH
jgi:hypothetical protein